MAASQPVRLPAGQLPSDEVLKLSRASLQALSQDEDPSEQALLNLHAVFGATLKPAMELVDRGEVVQIKLPAGRVLHQVASSTGHPYTLFFPDQLSASHLPYCPCAAFAFSAISGGKTVVCKHLLALRIAQLTGRMVETEIQEEAVVGLLGITR